MLRVILLTGTIIHEDEINNCYSNQFVKDWYETKAIQFLQFLSISNVWSMSRIWGQNDRN